MRENWLVQGIESQSMWREFRVLTTRTQVLMCRELNFHNKIKIVLQKIQIDKKTLAPPEKPEIKYEALSYL